MTLVEKLERQLVEEYGPCEDDVHIVRIPEAWASAPWCFLAYGPRRGAIGQDSPFWCDDELLLSIIRMFRTLYEVCSDEVEKGSFAVVDPSLDNISLIAIMASDRSRLLCYCQWKAWHFQWDTPDELEHAMEKAIAEIRQNVERAGAAPKALREACEWILELFKPDERPQALRGWCKVAGIELPEDAIEPE